MGKSVIGIDSQVKWLCNSHGYLWAPAPIGSDRMKHDAWVATLIFAPVPAQCYDVLNVLALARK